MATKKQPPTGPAGPAPGTPEHFEQLAAEQLPALLEQAAAAHRSWLMEAADAIERGGALPESVDERRSIASAIRAGAASFQPDSAKRKRGNPNFQPKAGSAIDVALAVRCALAEVRSLPDAIALVAEQRGVDDSTIAKLYRNRDTSLDGMFDQFARRKSARG